MLASGLFLPSTADQPSAYPLQPVTFEQWRELSRVLDVRANRLQASILSRARQMATSAGLDGSMPFQHAHNAVHSFEYGRPWADVDYSRARLVLRLERRIWAIGSLRDRILSRAWRKVTDR